MRLLPGFIMVFSLVLFSGCSPRITNLVNLSENRRQMGAEIKRGGQHYDSLKDDIIGLRLQRGMAKKEIIGRYGNPLLSRESFFLYLYPSKYFTSDSIYLYFDKNSRLESWHIIPAKNK